MNQSTKIYNIALAKKNTKFKSIIILVYKGSYIQKNLN